MGVAVFDLGPLKILALKFKYLGDVVVMVPALRALRARYPESELHVLVAAEAAPLLEGLPWLDKIWPLTRDRGKARLSETMPLIKELRAEHFDRSVDFVGNDRGALLSRLVGADVRLGLRPQSGSGARRLCYTETIEELDTTRHEVVRDYYVLTPWQVPPPESWELELARPAAPSTLPEGTILCHLSTSQRKKELGPTTWAAVGQGLSKAGHSVRFSAGPTEREQALLSDLKKLWPEADVLPTSPSLQDFMALVAGARLFASPDTAPLHIAAGLGVPTLGLFGPTSAARWSPPGSQHHALSGALCPCSGHLEQCAQSSRCIDALSPDRILAKLREMLA